MVVGTTLTVLSGEDYYSESFRRGGLAATFSLDVTHFHGVTSLDITVQHRNEDETAFTNAGSFSALSGTGVADVDITGLKQILRFKYSFTGGNPEDGVHVVMQSPAWRPYA